MVMQEARDGCDMRPFHNRQPVFLNRESAAVWLDPGAAYADLLVSPPKGTLAFDPPEPVGA
jgi:putative SOS response-associated peptidase YedK